MFIKNYQVFFLAPLFTGTIMAVSTNSWFTCWIGLEINLMSMIPLILSEVNFKSTEASIKYFLAQAMASVMLISTACLLSLQEGMNSMENFNNFIFLALAIKAGMAPFHLWYPQVMSCLSWFKCSIILIWQKISPFILMSCFLSKNLMYTLMVMSAVVGAAGGLNQPDMKMLLTYSSIAHSAWMLMATSISSLLWIFYFTIYSSVLFPLVSILFLLNLTNIKEINKTKMSLNTKGLLSIMIMSLGGLPPFMGFAAKLTVLMMAIEIYSMAILLVLISSSLTSLYFYTKMFYNLLVGATVENKINSVSKDNFNAMLLALVLAGNIFISFVVLLI